MGIAAGRPSRGVRRPSFASNFTLLFGREGAGKIGCALHPRSRVQVAHKERAHEHTGSAESIRPSLRNGFTAYFVLSPVNGFVATVIAQELASANLTPAPRRQDHTTSPYASSHASSVAASRVHRIPPRVRDDREPPLLPGGTTHETTDLGENKREIFSHRVLDQPLA